MDVTENVQSKTEKRLENVCSVCYKKFTAKKNLLKHLRDVHKNFKEAERMVVKKIKCPESDCDYLCRMMKELRSHIEICHNIKILKDTLQFPDETVFQKWKKEEESNTVSWFVTGRKKTTLTDGTKKQTLCCHRTGHYNPKGFGKYRMRSVGSCKIGVTCPASMEITEFSNGQLSVVYYKTHLGHRQDVTYLKLSKEERANLAQKIEQGFTFDSILDDVRESAHLKNLETKRIHLLSKKDLYRIMRSASGSQGKKLKKDFKSMDGVKEDFEVPKIGDVPQNLIVGNLTMEKLDKNLQQNFTLYPGQGVILPQECTVTNETTLLKSQKTSVPPYTSGENLPPQIVILSRDVDCTSVAEIIFLPAGETVLQSRIVPESKILAVEEPSKSENIPCQTSPKLTLEEKNKLNKTNLRLQLKEKLDRITLLLPQVEFLTPKQFALVGTKLDAVLNMFNVADVKAKVKAKKKGMKKWTTYGPAS